jgi:hypothetical protein
MNAFALNLKKTIPLTLMLGILGGIGLIMANAIFIPYAPYATLVIVTFVALRLADLPNIEQRFSTAFLAFMLATIILHTFTEIETGTLAKTPVLEHIWMLGLMAIIGGSLSLNVAVLSDNVFKPASTVFVGLLLAGLAPFIVSFIIRIIGPGTIAGTGIIAKILGFWATVSSIGLLAMIVAVLV